MKLQYFWKNPQVQIQNENAASTHRSWGTVRPNSGRWNRRPSICRGQTLQPWPSPQKCSRGDPATACCAPSRSSCTSPRRTEPWGWTCSRNKALWSSCSPPVPVPASSRRIWRWRCAWICFLPPLSSALRETLLPRLLRCSWQCKIKLLFEDNEIIDITIII